MKQKQYSDILAMFGFCLLGAYSFFAAIYLLDFSKIHIHLPFLNFPIFIGEIVLLICLVIFLMLIRQGSILLTPWHGGILIYLALMVVWVMLDYFRLGHQALAMRNGMLFIYPICSLFTYSFYRPAIFTKTFCCLLAILLFLVGLISTNGIASFGCFLLFLIIITKIFQQPLRSVVFILALVFWPYGSFLSSARTWLVAAVVAYIFLGIIFIKYFFPLERKWKVIFSLVLMGVFMLGIFHFANKTRGKTLLRPAGLIHKYQEAKAIIKEKESFFHPETLPVNLYNYQTGQGKKFINVTMDRTKIVPSSRLETFKPVPAPATAPHQEIIVRIKSSLETTVPPKQQVPVIESHSISDEENTVKDAYNNVVFRILIWEDMIHEVWDKKCVLGVGMGEPQRSRNIEILGWADGEWKRDGWITPHNSYLHLIYRAGIIGIGLIVILITVFYQMVGYFTKRHCWQGILLSGIIIYGMVAANFLLIFELPYYAIPFWSIWGIALAVKQSLGKNEKLMGGKV